jgi:TolB-like protein
MVAIAPVQVASETKDIVGILPFIGFTQTPSVDFSISGFCEFLSQKLSLFQDIRVVSFHSASRFMKEDGNLEHIADALGLTYYLAGSIELKKEQLQVSYQLFEAKSNSLIWSQQTDASLLSTEVMVAADTISSQIVASLAGYSGFIHYRTLLDKNHIPPLSNKMANAIFWFYHNQVHHTSSMFYQAIERLEAVVAEDENCALCWAVLAHLYADALIYNYNTAKEPLTTAQAYLDKAFDLDPICQHAHLAKGWIHILKREKYEASAMFVKTDELNPNSTSFKAMCSLGMALIGEYDKSIDYLRQIKQLNPLPYWWMNIPELFVALKNEDYNKVVFFARKSSTPQMIFEHVFEMIGLYYLEDFAALKVLAKVYQDKYPDGISFLKQALPAILSDDEVAAIISKALQHIETYFLQSGHN